jgi:hypothetical protein
MIENNPLRQYFRRPSIYFKLPSGGKYYDPSVVDIPPNGEIPVYPMTAVDEMTVRTPDALFNGTAVVELIKSCVPNIRDPWKINNIDLDAVLVAIRAASGNGKINIQSQCPSCSEVSEYDVNVMPLLAQMKDVDYTNTLKIHELSIKFRPLTYVEINENGQNQFEIQKILTELQNFEETDQKQQLMTDAIKRLNTLVTTIVAKTIEHIQTPESTVTQSQYIIDFLNNCDRETSNAIKDYSVKIREASELPELDVKCGHCQHDYHQRVILNVTDFFD